MIKENKREEKRREEKYEKLLKKERKKIFSFVHEKCENLKIIENWM